MHKTEQIKKYWEVSPPYKGEGEAGSLEWSKSISDHRYSLAPYLKPFMNAETYKGKNVLEIGCGSGSDLLEFARAGADVTGIDITDKAIVTTKERFKLHGLDADLRTYSGKELPFDKGQFDLVYSYGVLHHTPYMEDIFVDIYRVLKESGQMKLMLYNKYSLLYYYSILYLRKYIEKSDLNREELLSKYSEFREGCPHTRCFTAMEICQKIQYFSTVSTRSDFCVYDTQTNRKLPVVNFDVNADIENTGTADIDFFFKEFSEVVSHTSNLNKFGWHLLVSAFK